MFASIKNEIKRKLFHLLALVYIAAFWYLPKTVVLVALAVLIAITIAGEITRALNSRFNDLVLKIFDGVYRESEKYKVAGVLWTLAGAFLTIIIFNDKLCVLASFLYLVFGDTSAALFGKAFGKHKFFHESKSLEGSAACFFTCLIIGLVVFPSWQLAIAGAFAATIIETIPWPLNDNLWMQVVNAGILTLLTRTLFI